MQGASFSVLTALMLFYSQDPCQGPATPQPAEPERRRCDRCSKVYGVDADGKAVSKENCVYHWGRRVVLKRGGKATFKEKLLTKRKDWTVSEPLMVTYGFICAPQPSSSAARLPPTLPAALAIRAARQRPATSPRSSTPTTCAASSRPPPTTRAARAAIASTP